MSKFKFGMPLLGFAAIAYGLVGCADESPWGNSSNEKGTIDISLTTDSGIATKKPLFRSGEDEASANDLSSYADVPSADDFSIRLDKNDGTYSKTWSTLDDFKSEAASSSFNTGSYTLTAFYGTKGQQDFESPYFEASTSLSVLSDQTTSVSLTAELKNSMVKINYSDGFVDYMSDYYTALSTEGRVGEIVFNSAESRVAFIEPNNASLTVYFTTREKGYTSSLNLGQFAPEAKTVHNITLDVTENDKGIASLDVIFDEGLTQETVNIDLTDELLTSQPPVITCTGFENGETVDMLEGTASDVQLKMTITAQSVIKNAILTVESDNYTPGWGAEIDLCNATEEQQLAITNAGISAIGFFGIRSEGAFLDITEFGKSLKNGVYAISLKVTDSNEVVSEKTTVILNSLPISLEMVGDPSIVYGSGQAVLVMDYNGLNPDTDLTFQAWNAVGTYENVRIISCEEDASTRAYETRRYIYTLELPATTKSMIMIKVLYNNNNIGEYEVPVIIPEYNISAVDAFSRYAYLRVETPNSSDPSTLAAVVSNISLQDGNGNSLNILKRELGTGILTVSGLTPASTYSLKSNITGEDSWNSESLSIETENELSIPNGDFSEQDSSISSSETLYVGFGYLVGAITYKPRSSFNYPLPKYWGTINAKTAYAGSSSYNSWYVVPSSWLDEDSGRGLIRNVGYNNSGSYYVDDDKSGSFWSTTYYCTTTPNDLIQAAGELFLGSYSFNGSSETYDEGTAFSSRPSSITFDYEYEPDGSDYGLAKVEVWDASDEYLLAEGECSISSGVGSQTVELNYDKFSLKAATLKIKFKSSNSDNPPITIPSGSNLNEGTGLSTNGNNTIDANEYKAVATGSVLMIDNVTANYNDLASSANAPKRKSSNKR